jgi:hypothetical protein
MKIDQLKDIRHLLIKGHAHAARLALDALIIAEEQRATTDGQV